MKTRQTLLRILLAVYLVVLGVCAGVALDRMRFDRQRSEVIGRYEQALREQQEVHMALEKYSADSREERR